MPDYRRFRVEGGVYFFTVVTYRRRAVFHDACARSLLREAIRTVCAGGAWSTEAMVLLPDHFHVIWRLPEGDSDYSRRLGLIKREFTKAYLAAGFSGLEVTPGEARKGYRGVWQVRFWEHTIRDARDFKMHLDYVHANPVKHGLARRPAEWEWSSFHRYVKLGKYDSQWCGRVDLPGEVEYFWPDPE